MDGEDADNNDSRKSGFGPKWSIHGGTSSKGSSKKNSIISEVSDEFTNAFTESLSGNRQRKRKSSIRRGAALSFFSRKRKKTQPNKVKLESSMKNSLGSNKFISGQRLKQAQSQLKLVDTAADKHTAYQRHKKTKEIYYEIEHEIPAFIKEDPYGLIGVNENLLADNFDQQEPASNIYSDDVALYSLKRLRNIDLGKLATYENLVKFI